MAELVRRIPPPAHGRPEHLLMREWLVTNGLGGYASGTLAGVLTRRYHGLLIAALPAPHGRRVVLSDVIEQLRFPDGDVIRLGGEDPADHGMLKLHGSEHLKEFRLELGLPFWVYEACGIVLEKRLLLIHGQNTVHVSYRMLEGRGNVRLELRPGMNFRHHEAPVSETSGGLNRATVIGDQYEFSLQGDPIRLRMMIAGQGGAFTFDARQIQEVLYRMEENRGYEARGELWSPGYFHVDLSTNHDATLIASTESWETVRTMSPDEAHTAEMERRRVLLALADPRAREGPAAELVLAADQFLIQPAGRVQDAARAHAAGHEVRTVIAGYHWFTDWGRDTMISLEGLTLTTGREMEAGWILRTFAYYIRDGLLPNMFPEGEREGLYHTADATLWFFHAIHRYLVATNDRPTLLRILPKLLDIVDHHIQGTRFNIRVDPDDGLLSQGAPDYQLTWMDAKVDQWVVTPRRGKAVEINALWYNALRLLEGWLREVGDPTSANRMKSYAERACVSFNRRFWYQEGGYLYDVVDGEDGKDDPSLRPNQVFAIALDHPVLERSKWEPVMKIVEEKLLTPVGLRSLAPGHPDYKPRYYGDLRSRDAAYHQGTVWAWLIGPFIDAWLKLHPGDPSAAHKFLEGLAGEMSELCIGTLSEIYDAEPPYTPRGCVSQAWSIAEALRCWVKTAK